MIKEAIILAGGLGTRLRSVVADLPKCLADVNGRPFLFYVLQYLKRNGIKKFIFSLGYKSSEVEAFIKLNLLKADYSVVVEQDPLGTGGGIQLAMDKTKDSHCIVVNGDTYFDVNLQDFSLLHINEDADCTISLKPMENFSRYGSVEIDDNYTIVSFKEKQFIESGFINGGVYALNKATFLQHNFASKFSFEKDYLEPNVGSKKLKGFIQDEYFIDIGIPEDYKKAQTELIAHI
ncbi:MAG: nucleotidyltransferase family protein [Ginsengibacter sp.]